MPLDNPHVRADRICPLCAHPKGTDRLVCWPCYRAFDLKHGNPEAEEQIAMRERFLAARSHLNPLKGL